MIHSYIQSYPHRWGCIGAIIACILILCGLFSNISWIIIILLFYIGGFLLSFFKHPLIEDTAAEQSVQPPPPPTTLPKVEPKQPYNAPIHEKLLADFRQIERQSYSQLGREAKRLMQEIDSIMQFMSTKIQQSQDQTFKFEISDIQRTMTSYLSPALQHYCQLPNFLRERPLSDLNQTPSQLLEQQLNIILEELKKIAESIYINDLNQVIDHGQFLKIKLEQNSFFKIDSSN